VVKSFIQKLSNSSIALRLFFTCWLVYTLHFATNTVREIFPALSLGDHLSFDVSEYAGLHPDIFEIPGRGAYINNNPGASILGAIPYALSRPIIDRITHFIQLRRQASSQPMPEYETIYPMAREFFHQAYKRGLDIKFGLAAGVMQAFLMAPLAALSVAGMYFAWFSLTSQAKTALFLALIYAFATPIFYRVAQLNHNMLQAVFAWFAFLLIWQPWNPHQSISNKEVQPQRYKVPRHTLAYFLAGLLTGWTLVLDYSGIIIIVSIGGYAFFTQLRLPGNSRRWLDLVWFGSGVIICILSLMAYQWHAFGNPFFPAQHYMPDTTYSGMGYRGMDWPQLDLLWENTFGIRYGLFIAAPVLILVFYLPAWLPRKKQLIGGLETWLVIFLTLSFFLFTAANQFSRMQFNSGVRHVVPVVPFLYLLVATVLLRMRPWLAGLVGGLSIFWTWCLVMYRDVEQGWGIIGAILSTLSHGVRLPWLATLEAMGYAPGGLSWAVLTLAGLLILLIWIARPLKGKKPVS
jgi:hypothetical protein